jgi:hypothetical protein
LDNSTCADAADTDRRRAVATRAETLCIAFLLSV